MQDDFETAMRLQLAMLKSQMEVIREYIEKYDERSSKLRRTITEDLINALIKRFERNEKTIQEMNEKVDSMGMKLNENLEKSLRQLREEIGEGELSKAISKIFDEKEIKVSSRVLENLNNL